MDQSLTNAKGGAKSFPPDAAKHQATSVIDAIHLWMPPLEDADNVVRPRSNARNGQQANEARDEPQSVECRRYRQDAQANLRLHHECHGSDPSNLSIGQFFLTTRAPRENLHCGSWAPFPSSCQTRHRGRLRRRRNPGARLPRPTGVAARPRGQRTRTCWTFRARHAGWMGVAGKALAAES